MAEDDSQKTEDPTGKKLSTARDKGQVITSREINVWFMMLAMTAFAVLLAPRLVASIKEITYKFIASSHLIPFDGALWDTVGDTLKALALALMLPSLLLMAAALVGPFLQNSVVFSTTRLAPTLDRLSPLTGFKRIFSLTGIFEFLKAVIKAVIVSTVLWYSIRPEIDRLPLLQTMPVEELLPEIRSLVIRMMIGVMSVLTALAIGDYTYQRFQFLKSMRMSKQEVKEEHKQQEGDPVIRGRLRQIRMERSRRRMMAAVPTASVVVTNPTHFAVALKYDMADSGAPMVVAKGADLMAAKIREVARENDVPIVENPPLARALYGGVEIDEEIPPEHYKAVAAIISYVFKLKGKFKPNPAASNPVIPSVPAP